MAIAAMKVISIAPHIGCQFEAIGSTVTQGISTLVPIFFLADAYRSVTFSVCGKDLCGYDCCRALITEL